MIQLHCRQSVEMGPNCVVDIVDGGQQTPQPVDLRVVAVDLRDGKHDRGDEHGGKSQRCHERVGVDIEGLECLWVGYVCCDLVREVVVLGKERLYRLEVVGALGQRLDKGQRHIHVCPWVGHRLDEVC